MNYQELSFASRLLDPLSDQPKIQVNRASLAGIPDNRTQELLTLFFGTEDCRQISRSDVMALSRRNKDLFSLSVLFWGFPANQRGICRKAFQNWDTLLKWISTLRGNRSITQRQFVEMIPTMDNDLHGLGISTLSKYLYYTGCSINGHSCLILDNQVAKGIQNLEGNEFNELKAATQNSHHRFYKYYPSYLEAMHNLSLSIGAPAQNIEYVLWLAAKKGI